jgi:protein SSD1
LRQERVFTIDPASARDLDDALSVKVNDDGTYDIGVHIADVSFFVKPNTALDRDAKKRATSVYLVQRAVPMLPPTLSEELCSLHFGKDRLTFSVIFTMTKEGKVTKKWFGRTVIKSSAQLSYTNVQDVIDGKVLGGVPVVPEHDASAIEHDIKILHDIAKDLRERRFKNGALSTETPKMAFSLDESGRPVDCDQSLPNDANSLVQEVCYIDRCIWVAKLTWVRSQFMLLTNIAVAEQVAVNFPEQALLRRHDTPIERRLVRD